MNSQNLSDISQIKINPTLQKSEKISQYIKNIDNPYHFRVGDTPVHIEFTNGGQSLQDIFTKIVENHL